MTVLVLSDRQPRPRVFAPPPSEADAKLRASIPHFSLMPDEPQS